jgi:hypothetical protein
MITIIPVWTSELYLCSSKYVYADSNMYSFMNNFAALMYFFVSYSSQIPQSHTCLRTIKISYIFTYIHIIYSEIYVHYTHLYMYVYMYIYHSSQIPHSHTVCGLHRRECRIFGTLTPSKYPLWIWFTPSNRILMVYEAYIFYIITLNIKKFDTLNFYFHFYYIFLFFRC